MTDYKTYKAEMKRRQQENAARYMEQVQVGDIFVCCWGYGQTNVDYYQVTKKTAKTVTVRPIESKGVDTGWCQRDVMPVRDAFTSDVHVPFEGKRCKMQGYSSRPAITICSYADAYLWDGKPAHETSWA